jgi:Lon protease-like protein
MLGTAFYPSGNTFLNIFEMKYRTMMFDIAQTDDMFGYIHSDGGRLGTVGTICRVVERKLEDDGRQLIRLEGVERFRVNKISKTLPYIVANVHFPYTDTVPVDVDEEANAAKLAMEVWQYLKFYVRMMRLYGPNQDMVVSAAAKRCRPTLPSVSASEAHSQRTAFSFSVANMIQMTQPRESQLILQTQDLVQRLDAEHSILVSASDLIAGQLIQMGILDEAKKEELRSRSFSMMDSDDDILPVEAAAAGGTDNDDDEWDISRIE